MTVIINAKISIASATPWIRLRQSHFAQPGGSRGSRSARNGNGVALALGTEMCAATRDDDIGLWCAQNDEFVVAKALSRSHTTACQRNLARRIVRMSRRWRGGARSKRILSRTSTTRASSRQCGRLLQCRLVPCQQNDCYAMLTMWKVPCAATNRPPCST